MTRRAIILAAGVGRRLRPSLAPDEPKCLVRLGADSLLGFQLTQLKAVGVDEVVVVVGHGADKVRAAATAAAGPAMRVRFEHNPNPATTNTLVSFGLARAWMDTPFYGLNGDVLFSRRLLRLIRDTDQPIALAVEAKRCGDEEVKVITDAHDRVLALSKGLPPEACIGEFVGVAHFDERGAAGFRRSIAATLGSPEAANAYFELAIERVVDELPVKAVVLPPDEPVIEIDFAEDLVRAREEILPRVTSVDQCLA